MMHGIPLLFREALVSEHIKMETWESSGDVIEINSQR